MGAMVIIVILWAYFLPSIVAMGRDLPNWAQVMIINLFLGWTFLGWVIALAMSCGPSKPVVVVNVNNTEGK